MKDNMKNNMDNIARNKSNRTLARKAVGMTIAGIIAVACSMGLSGCGGDIAIPKDPNGIGGIIMQDESANARDAAGDRGGAMVIDPDNAVDPGMIVEPGIGGSEGDVVAPDSSKTYL